jgi:hypothetical protein
MSVGFGCPLSLHKPATPLKQEVHRRPLLYTISILFISADGCVVQCTHIVIRFLLCPAYLCHDMFCVFVHTHREGMLVGWPCPASWPAWMERGRGRRYLDCDAYLKRKSCIQVVAINSGCWYIVFVLKQPS